MIYTPFIDKSPSISIRSITIHREGIFTVGPFGAFDSYEVLENYLKRKKLQNCCNWELTEIEGRLTYMPKGKLVTIRNSLYRRAFSEVVDFYRSLNDAPEYNIFCRDAYAYGGLESVIYDGVPDMEQTICLRAIPPYGYLSELLPPTSAYLVDEEKDQYTILIKGDIFPHHFTKEKLLPLLEGADRRPREEVVTDFGYLEAARRINRQRINLLGALERLNSDIENRNKAYREFCRVHRPEKEVKDVAYETNVPLKSAEIYRGDVIYELDKEIILDIGGGKTISYGKPKITFYRNGGVFIDFTNGRRHPHVNGTACFGDYYELLRKAATEKDIDGVLTTIVVFLESYNPRSSYVSKELLEEYAEEDRNNGR